MTKPERDFTGLTNYRKNGVEVEDLFKRMKRVLNQQILWLEEEMFKVPKGEAKPGFNAQLARLAKDLNGAVTALGQMFLRIEEKAAAASSALTTKEQIEAICNLVRAEGRTNRQRYLRAFQKLDYEINGSKAPTNSSRS